MRVYIGIGSNYDGKLNIQRGLQALRERYGRLQISPVYESEPVGCNGNNYYNLVVGIDCVEPCMTIAAGLREIEASFGRSVDNSRALDLDLLLYGNQVVNETGLCLPRSDILDCAYVLKPLADVAGDQVHPLAGRTYLELWRAFDRTDQRLWPADVETNCIMNIERAER